VQCKTTMQDKIKPYDSYNYTSAFKRDNFSLYFNCWIVSTPVSSKGREFQYNGPHILIVVVPHSNLWYITASGGSTLKFMSYHQDLPAKGFEHCSNVKLIIFSWNPWWDSFKDLWPFGNRTWAYHGLPFGKPLWFVAALVNKLVPWALSGAIEILRLRLRPIPRWNFFQARAF